MESLKKSQPLGPLSWTIVMTNASEAGWEGTLRRSGGPGQMGLPCQGNGLQCAGAMSRHFGSPSPAPQDQGSPSYTANGQQGQSGLYSTLGGGTLSSTLTKEVEPIMAWAEVHLQSLRAVYLLGRLNTQVDHLSRKFPDHTE